MEDFIYEGISAFTPRVKLRLLVMLLFAYFIHLSSFAQPPVNKKMFHLFLLAGQSNMAGRGAIEAQDTITNAKIWMLNKTGEWELAKEPLHFDKPNVAGVGPGFAFAKRILAQDTSVFIGLIPCAVGGSPIDVWEHGKYYEPTKSYPYDEALQRTKLAMQSGLLKGILWHQGESDSDSLHAGVYVVKLTAMVQRFRKDLRMKSLPFIAGTVADFYVAKHPYGMQVNAGIETLPQHLKKVAVVHTDGLSHNGDTTHFNCASAREVGIRYAELFIEKFKEK